MSSDSFSAKSLDAELEAALVGDFERLEEGSDEAKFFAQAFGPDLGGQNWEEIDPQTPLGLAAFSVSCERQEQTEAAQQSYEKLLAGEPWVRLLGLLLRAWSPSLDDTEALREAEIELKKLRASSRKARLLAKLSLIAADRGVLPMAQGLWSQGLASAPKNSRLRRVLATEALNFGLPQIDESAFAPAQGREDPLLFPRSLTELRFKSLSNGLAQATEDAFNGTWSYTMRMGITPLDEIYAADLQATWRGVSWLRRSIRKQIGAQLLAGAAGDPSQWAYGVLMWILGGGNPKPNKALSYAEPRLDADGADFIVKATGESDLSQNRLLHLASLGAEGWDLVSEENLEWLAEQIPLQPGDGFPREEGRLIWAGFALRLTESWFAKYRQLETDAQAALLQQLTPHSLRHFDSEVRETMFAAVAETETLASEDGVILPMAVALADEKERKRIGKILDQTSVAARVVSQLLDEQPEIVSSERRKRTLRALKEQLSSQLEEAREGTIYGGASPALELGRFLSVAVERDNQATELLIKTARDPALPIRYVLDARQGLILLRRAQLLSDAQLESLSNAPDPGPHLPQFEQISPMVVRMFLLRLLADRLRSQQITELEIAVRDPDDKVRSVSVNACAEALVYGDSEGLAWAVVSGLFDPAHSVAEGALGGLAQLTERFDGPADVAWRRLPVLLDVGSRNVRRAVIEAVRESTPVNDFQHERKEGLLSRARQDRSWRIRDLVAQVEAQSG